MEVLGVAFPKEQARVRTVLGYYHELGPVGVFGAAMIEDVLRNAGDHRVTSKRPRIGPCRDPLHLWFLE